MTKARGASRPRFRLLPTVLLTLAILGLPTVVYAWGRSSSSFDIERITVSGTKLVKEKRALRLLRREYQGRNLFTVTAGDVRSTLSSECFVSSVSVDRDFPGTLNVTIVEHVPLVYALAGDGWYVLDGRGYVVCEVEDDAEDSSGDASTTESEATSDATAAGAGDASAAGDSSATGDESGTGDESASGDEQNGRLERLVAGPTDSSLGLPRVELTKAARVGSVARGSGLAGMLQVVAALPRSLRSRLDVVQSDEGQMTLRFADGPVTVWGDAERTLAKTVAVRTVLAEYEAAGKTCKQLDVSIPDRVLGKPVLE